MDFFLPSPVARALQMLETAGFSAYVVGGCVRDWVLGIPPHDFDICTSAIPEEMKKVFRDERTIETGIQHGTLTVLMEGEPLEITTFRLDGEYLDGRHPSSVAFTRKIEEDLSRRDFTVNAMAYSPGEGLCDPFGGQEDCRAGIIRCVGEPERRFTEDALRILRALRFSARLDFPIEPETAKAIFQLKENLEKISKERIAAELTGLLMGQRAEVILDIFWDVAAFVLPALTEKKQVNLSLLSQAPRDPALRWAALLGMCDGEAIACAQKARATLQMLKMPVKLQENVAALIAHRDFRVAPETLQELLMRLGPENALGFLQLYYGKEKMLQEALQRLIDENACYSLKQLQVNGKDLAALGLRGPQIGETLNRLLLRVVRGETENKKEALLQEASMQ